MTIPISVSLSGPSFSFLLYENSKCRFQQEGFLLGEILHKETKTITDNDQQQVNVTKTIKINSVLPCPQRHFFYNGIGIIDKNRIKDFLGDQFGNVVAWYKFQKITSFKFSMRDRIIHKQLIDLFGIAADLFTCCFLINEISDNGSTHLFSQSFVRFHYNQFNRLPIHIPNLSEPNNTYKTCEPSSPAFSKLLTELKIDKQTTQGLVVINKIENALQKHIDKVIKSLSISEQYMHELEEEIKLLELKKINKKINEEKDEEDASLESSSSQDRIKINSPFNKSFSPEISPDKNISVLKQNNQKLRGRSSNNARETRKGIK